MRQQLKAFEVTEAQLLDSGVDLDAEYVPKSREVALGLISVVEDLVLAPHRTNISEGGFSVSWDMTNLAKYYKYMCSKWGVPMNKEVTDIIQIPTITDVSNEW